MEPHGAVARSLMSQANARRQALTEGAAHVGWKVAKDMPGVDEHWGPGSIVFGYLTSTSVLPSGEQYRTCAVETLHAETELAVTLGRDIDPTADAAECTDAIAGFAVAIEIVDVAKPPGGGMHEIIAENVFHRAVAFGPTHPVTSIADRVPARIAINGAVRETGTVGFRCGPLLVAMARLLTVIGEQLRAGDRVITGSINHVPIQIGDVATAEIDGLGSATISIVSDTTPC